MKYRLKSLIFLVLALALMPAYAAKKERLVLMPLHATEVDRSLIASMEASLVEGLKEQYTVFAGEQVQKKVKEVFEKESKTTKKDCDETRCIQDIAIAFQAELVAVTNVTKRSGGYILTVTIRNISNDEIVDSKSEPCEGCNEFQIINKLKSLASVGFGSGTPSGILAAPGVAPSAPSGGFNLNDLDQQAKAQEGVKAQWSTYLEQMQKAYDQAQTQDKAAGRADTKLKTWEAFVNDYLQDDPYSTEDETMRNQAGLRVVALKQQAATEATQDKWTKYLADMKQAFEQVESYDKRDISNDLKLKAWEKFQAAFTLDYPSSKEDDTQRAQAQTRIAELKQSISSAPKMVAPIAPKATSVSDGTTFRDCTDCPEMVKLPGQKIAMGKYEVTQGQWRALMGDNPSNFKDCGDNCPVEQVSWNDAQKYIEKLNKETGKAYRLPTEAEWELACRAGRQQEYCGSDSVDEVAWYSGNSGPKNHPVGQKKPNAWGLYDMSGNVWEWTSSCRDGNCGERVQLGGSVVVSPYSVRAASLSGDPPGIRSDSVGFRLARNL